MNRLINYLPTYERKSEIFKEITRVEEIEFDKLDLDLKDLEKQFLVDTATWGLAIYEKELKLPIRPGKSLEERRSIIKAKMRGMGKVDAKMIKAIISLFTKTPVEIRFDGQINIVFDGFNNTQLGNIDMLNAIEEVKPAHLGKRFTVEDSQNLNLFFGGAIRGLKKIVFRPQTLEDITLTQGLYSGVRTRQSKRVVLNPAILNENISLTRSIYPSTTIMQSKKIVAYPNAPDSNIEIKQDVKIIGVNKTVRKLVIK